MYLSLEKPLLLTSSCVILGLASVWYLRPIEDPSGTSPALESPIDTTGTDRLNEKERIDLFSQTRQAPRALTPSKNLSAMAPAPGLRDIPSDVRERHRPPVSMPAVPHSPQRRVSPHRSNAKVHPMPVRPTRVPPAPIDLQTRARYKQHILGRLADRSSQQAQRTPLYRDDVGEEALHRRAEQVAIEAEHRLAGIKNVTDLSPAQEDVIFGIYAGASPAFHPGMVLDTSNASGAIRRPTDVRVPSDSPLANPAPPAVPPRAGKSTPIPAPFDRDVRVVDGPGLGTSDVVEGIRPALPALLEPSPVSPSAITEADVLGVLAPRQQAALVETWELEDDLWTFIVDDLNDQLDEDIDLAIDMIHQVPAEPIFQPVAAPAPVDSGAYQGQNLFLFGP